MFPDITKCPEGGGELGKLLLIENHYLKRTEGNDNNKQSKEKKKWELETPGDTKGCLRKNIKSELIYMIF